MEMDGNVKRDADLGQYTKWKKAIIGVMQSKDKKTKIMESLSWSDQR